MAKDLEEALVNNPEAKLDGEEKPQHMDLGGHLEYIESLLEQGAGGAGVSDLYFDLSPFMETMQLDDESFEKFVNDISEGKIIGVTLIGTGLFFDYKGIKQNNPEYWFCFSNSTEAVLINSTGAISTGNSLDIPFLPTDASTKNYTLNSVNGALTWNTIGNGLEIKDGALQATGSGGGQSIEDLPVVELPSEVTTITDETVKAEILENVNNDNYLICKLKMPHLSTIEILITRDAKLLPNDVIENTVFTQTAFINLGLVASTFAFTLSINSKDGTITIVYEMLGYIEDYQVSLIQKTNESFSVTADYGDTNVVKGLTLYFDTINGKPIIHKDTTVNSYNIPTITFED